jgi:hypothetical protein
MTYAMVWLPLPMREMPMDVPSRSAMFWYSDFTPVMTALSATCV